MAKIVRCQPNYLKTFSLYELDNFINVKILEMCLCPSFTFWQVGKMLGIIWQSY